MEFIHSITTGMLLTLSVAGLALIACFIIDLLDDILGPPHV